MDGWMYGSTFTGLLAGVENIQTIPHASHPTQLMLDTSRHQEPSVDQLGLDHEDFEHEDEEGAEVNTAANSMEREAASITPSWNMAEEPDPALMNLWQTWIAMDPLPNQHEIAIGQIFGSFDDLEAYITKWSVQRGKEFRVQKHEGSLYVVICMAKDQGCTWRISARKTSETMWRITRYAGDHVPRCARDISRADNRNVTQKFICQEILPLVRVDKSIQPRLIIAVIQQRYNVIVSYARAWGAKQKAIAEIFGDWEESYASLPRFLAAVQQFNPGTVAEWRTTRSEYGDGLVLERVFWSFGPSIRGFEHCRLLITIDGTHLYGKYKGCLLIAMGVDANDQLFPLAFALVEGENASWTWFMDILGRQVTQRDGLCVISDRHPGILKAMRDLQRWREPVAFHRYCLRHLLSNFHTRFKNKILKELARSAANVHDEAEFERRMDAIGLTNPDARKYLEDIEKEKWTLCYDNGHRYGVMTTNLSESFNGVLKGARSLPVTGIAQETFYKLNSYFVSRRADASKRGLQGKIFSKALDKKIQDNVKASRFAQVIVFDVRKNLYEVTVARDSDYERRMTYSVDLPNHTCKCQRWRNLKIACPHVLAVCRDQGFDHTDFIDHFYSTNARISTYQMSFHPVGDIIDWPVIQGLPVVPDPTTMRAPGRRQETRFKNEMDRSGVPGQSCCSYCRQLGHNKRTCPSRASGSGQ